jgi:hypothetical protein
MEDERVIHARLWLRWAAGVPFSFDGANSAVEILGGPRS